MQQEVIISGFGGQGVLFAGQILAYTAMDEDKEVTWIPSYGPEMRGGTANCTVVVSDGEIGSPFVRNPAAVIAMNLPSLDKYEPLVREGGTLVVNASIIDREVSRKDVNVVSIPANDIAEALGSQRSVNMVMLGALLSRVDLLSVEAVEEALKAHLPERHKQFLDANINALRKGASFRAGETAKA